MTADESTEEPVCPRCRSMTIYVTAVQHPRSTQMQQTTFVCYPCNRTWNYALSSEMASTYATKAMVATA